MVWENECPKISAGAPVEWLKITLNLRLLSRRCFNASTVTNGLKTISDSDCIKNLLEFVLDWGVDVAICMHWAIKNFIECREWCSGDIFILLIIKYITFGQQI